MHLLTVTQSSNMAATHNGDAVHIAAAKSVAVQAVWTGGSSPEGTYTFEVSNDGTNFTAYDSDADKAVTGNAGSLVWNYAVVGYLYCRMAYTRTSGSGTTAIKFVLKD